MALRHKHVTVLARLLFKVRTEALKKYGDNPEQLAFAYGIIDTIGLLIAMFLDTEMNNFDLDTFLKRFGYGEGIDGEGADSLLGPGKLEKVDV